VEHVQADEALLGAAGVGQALDRQRRRRAGDEGVVVGHVPEVAEETGLDLLVLADRLDDRGHLAERVEVGLHPHVGGVDLVLQEPADGEDAAPRSRGRAVRTRPEDDLAVPGGNRREAAGDGPAARYAESFMHAAAAPG